MRFLDLSIADDIPDSKTGWLFRERLTDLELVEELFSFFIKELETLGLIVNQGKIIDESFVEVPRQRNSRDENKETKQEKYPTHSRKIRLNSVKKIPTPAGYQRITKTISTIKTM